MAKGTYGRWRPTVPLPMLGSDNPPRSEPTMSHLRLVPPPGTGGIGGTAGTVPAILATDVDDRPRVSLRLLMAASGRCSCDACLIAYRLGDKTAGIVSPPRPSARLTAVRWRRGRRTRRQRCAEPAGRHRPSGRHADLGARPR